MDIETLTEYVSDLILYEPHSGVCVWNKRSRTEFSSAAKAKAWNNKHSGQEAGILNPNNGKLQVYLQGKTFGIDTLIWVLKTGKLPKDGVHHLNKQNADNRWENLTDRKQPGKPNRHKGGTIYLDRQELPATSERVIKNPLFQDHYYIVYSMGEPEHQNNYYVFSHHLSLANARAHQLKLADYLNTSWETLI